MFKRQIGSLIGIGGVIFFLLTLKPMQSAQLKLKAFLYTQDFEEIDPFKFWTTNGDYTENFKGLTEEKFVSGKKSFKLDVTFGEKGHYFYWGIPIKVPAEGNLKFSGHIYLGEETTGGTAGLGPNVLISSAPYEYASSGCGPFEKGKKGEWKLIEGDLVDFGKKVADAQISGGPAWLWGAKRENVGVYIDRIGLFIYGKKGERMVVYVDEIKIEGEVPGEEAYKETLKERWTPVKERFGEKISYWLKALSASEAELKTLNNLSAEANELKKEVERKLSSLNKTVEKAEKSGYITNGKQKEIDEFLGQFKNIVFNIKAISGE